MEFTRTRATSHSPLLYPLTLSCPPHPLFPIDSIDNQHSPVYTISCFCSNSSRTCIINRTDLIRSRTFVSSSSSSLVGVSYRSESALYSPHRGVLQLSSRRIVELVVLVELLASGASLSSCALAVFSSSHTFSGEPQRTLAKDDRHALVEQSA